MNLKDLRKIRPILFNSQKIGVDFNQDGIDGFVYENYLKSGDNFLNELNGEFAFVFQDKKENKIFAVRDWIGEVPLHYIIDGDIIYFANFITDLIDSVPNYSYDRVVAVNRSEVLEIDTNTKNIKKRLYYNFNEDKFNLDYTNLSKVAEKFHDLLFEAVKNRISHKTEESALLLSGGIDSMSVAFIISKINPNIPAYTIEVASQQATDLVRAKNIAKIFGLKHEIVTVSKQEIVDSIEESVSDSEIYHMYNVFCAVGMNGLAKILQSRGIKYVFTGEGGNEIFGDYHDWVIHDPATKKDVILQKTAKIFDEPIGREAYIWGNLKAEKIGRYNVQLGSGLGKHGGSRMYKPMFKKGITLLSPYLEKEITKIGTNIPTDILREIGGKPGFMKLVFSKEIERGEIPEEFFEIKKIRFQDASEGGETGITETLLVKGYDQEKLIEIFNRIFKASVVGQPHLKETTLIK